MGCHSCLWALHLQRAYGRPTCESLCAMPLALSGAQRHPSRARSTRDSTWQRKLGRTTRDQDEQSALFLLMVFDNQAPAQRVIVHALLVERGMLLQCHLPEATDGCRIAPLVSSRVLAALRVAQIRTMTIQCASCCYSRRDGGRLNQDTQHDDSNCRHNKPCAQMPEDCVGVPSVQCRAKLCHQGLGHHEARTSDFPF
jgi:hypothetical protein